MSIIREHNIETNEIVERPMTSEELEKYNSKQDNTGDRQKLLAKLGITEEEAKLLLS
jgi:hypothetical protein